MEGAETEPPAKKPNRATNEPTSGAKLDELYRLMDYMEKDIV
jgi:hypothetical protein